VADVFISYSKAEAEATRALAKDLEREGYTVWWDASIVPGEKFEEVILKELEAAKAVIVIWTASSVKSMWVKSEAARAARMDKLITVRDNALQHDDIPLPYDGFHTAPVSDRAAIYAALAKRKVPRSAPPSEAAVREAAPLRSLPPSHQVRPAPPPLSAPPPRPFTPPYRAEPTPPENAPPTPAPQASLRPSASQADLKASVSPGEPYKAEIRGAATQPAKASVKSKTKVSLSDDHVAIAIYYLFSTFPGLAIMFYSNNISMFGLGFFLSTLMVLSIAGAIAFCVPAIDKAAESILVSFFFLLWIIFGTYHCTIFGLPVLFSSFLIAILAYILVCLPSIAFVALIVRLI